MPHDSSQPAAMRSVGILVYDQVEVLDACGPFEVFATTRNEEGDLLFDVHVIAEHPEPIECVGGLFIHPHWTYENCPPLDILLIPGGAGRKIQMHRDATLRFVRQRARTAELVLSVCTGVFILAYARVIGRSRLTTHYSALDQLRAALPDAIVEEMRFVDDGRLITSAGIAAGIDMSLHVVARLHGEATARRTAMRMEHPWP